MTKLTLNQVEEFNAKVISRNLRGGTLLKYKQKLKLTQEQKDIIIGTLLGDSSIRNRKCNYCLKFEQKYTQLEYLNHLYKIFEPFVGTGPKMRIIKNNFHKEYGVSCWFRTYAHPCFTFYANLFYQVDSNNKRKKSIPQNIHKFLTPQALAYWYMDDGSLTISNNSYTLNTQGFKESDQRILIKALKRNFNLDFNIQKDRTYYRLGLRKTSNTDFYELVKPYILSSFEYKLIDK